MNRDQEAEFAAVLMAASAEVRRFGYKPIQFERMIRERGAYQTVKDLVAKKEPSSGFVELEANKRIDLTCEAIIVETKWRQFFDEDLLDIAEKRLRSFRYSWIPFDPSANREHDTPPTLTPVATTRSSLLDSRDDGAGLFECAPDDDGLKIHWNETAWVDAFAESEFTDECSARAGRQWIYHSKHDECPADFIANIHGNEAVLDYGGNAAAVNRRQDAELDIGTLRITFADDSRSIVRSAQWKPERSGTYSACDVVTSWSEATLPEHFVIPKADHRVRAVLISVLRPGQLRFRKQLLNIYGSTCCISRTSIEDTLEAAHVVPYRGIEYDHLENGILLRADLHRLFDRLLLSIRPSDLTVSLGASLLTDNQYKHLHGQLLEFGPSRYRPSRHALEHHWARFQRSSENNKL